MIGAGEVRALGGVVGPSKGCRLEPATLPQEDRRVTSQYVTVQPVRNVATEKSPAGVGPHSHFGEPLHQGRCPRNP